MKKLTLLTILILLATLSFSQVMKKKLDIGVMDYLEEDGWTDNEWRGCNLLCVIDQENDNIKIYSTVMQDYDLISDAEDVSFDDVQKVKYVAVDADGLICNFYFAEWEEEQFIMIEYNTVKWIYRVKND